MTLGSHIFWLFSALLIHVVRNIPLGIALLFLVLKVFLKRAPIFGGYSTSLKIYKILRVTSTTALPIPVYVQNAYRK